MVEVIAIEALRAAALAACDQARHERMISASRRIDARRAHATSKERRSHAVLLKRRVRSAREFRYRSAWSDLPWQMPDAELDRVLVAHNGET